MSKRDLQSASYEVGYGKPPLATQFQKGRSGNPSGRPKGRKNVSTVLQQALRQKVLVTEAGRRRIKTKLEIAVTQLVNKAASGDLVAMKHLLAMTSLLIDEKAGPAVSPDVVADREHARRLLARMSGAGESEPS
jgi:hypothetical protein